MKKLFTLCASAAIAFTLSAQADISEGSMFVYTSDATQLVKQSSGYEFDLNFGYAVRDNIVLSVGFDQNEDYLENTAINIGARYFWKGLFFQTNIGDVTQNLVDATGTGEYDQIPTGTFEQVGTGTFEQVGTGVFEDVVVGVDKLGNDIIESQEIMEDGAEIMEDGAEIMEDGDEIMEDVMRGRSITAGVGYLMQLDNIFDGGIPSNLYIEPYLGVLSSTAAESVTFSTSLAIGYRF